MPWQSVSTTVPVIRFNEQFLTLFDSAVKLSAEVGADALLILVDDVGDWDRLKQLAAGAKILIAADERADRGGGRPRLRHGRAENARCPCVREAYPGAPGERGRRYPGPRRRVVAIYSGFEAEAQDSISIIHLGEHLGQLTARDLRQLETSVPLDTLKTVVDIAVAIGREGREGKPVGTLFVVGDSRKVLASSHPTGFDPVRGYSRKERDLDDPRVREGIKEIAQLDGAIVVSAEGIVLAAARYIDAPAENLSLPKGLGARHWAAAAISRKTKAVAIAVSESNGSVRIFQDGEVTLRIEPFRRPMKWKDFEYEPPLAE